MLKGKMAVSSSMASVKVIEGPFIFASNPGRKFGACIEDAFFENTHATRQKQTSMKIAEDVSCEKSDAWRRTRNSRSEQVLAIDEAVHENILKDGTHNAGLQQQLPAPLLSVAQFNQSQQAKQHLRRQLLPRLGLRSSAASLMRSRNFLPHSSALEQRRLGSLLHIWASGQRLWSSSAPSPGWLGLKRSAQQSVRLSKEKNSKPLPVKAKRRSCKVRRRQAACAAATFKARWRSSARKFCLV